MLNVVRAWIVLSAVFCAAGWTLSLFRQLNFAGYGAMLALLILATVLWARRCFQEVPRGQRWVRIQHKFRRRFRRALPLSFFVLAFAVVLGGALYAPSHADALQYRTPRVLHWLAAGQWHWIHSADLRLNVISCGFEWLTAPLLLFTRTDRYLFVINAASYLMLPGLVFGVFRQLGVRPRVAWAWMWIFPSGWVYAMQAGGLGNDHFSTVYSLASVYFALRAKETQRVSDLWISLLACALVTGTKQTNIPLALLWIIAAWPTIRQAWTHPLSSLSVTALALLASGAPMIYLDLSHTGSWTGWAKGQDLQPESPFWGIVGNAFVLTLHNFAPPIFPWASQWQEARTHFLQTPFGGHFTSFEMFGATARAAAEQTAALGLSVCLLALVSVLAARTISHAHSLSGVREPLLSAPRLLRSAAWLLLLVFMAKVGSWNAPRYLAPYYPLLFPALLIGRGHDSLVRTRWWNALALVVMLTTIILIFSSRQRPLWPADTITAHLQTRWPRSDIVRKVRNAYVFGTGIRHSLQPLINLLPPDEHTVGYVTSSGSLEVQLWRPFGSRRVVRVTEEDSPEHLRKLGVLYVFVEKVDLPLARITIEDWTRRYQAEVLGKVAQDFGLEMPALECYLVRLRDEPARP